MVAVGPHSRRSSESAVARKNSQHPRCFAFPELEFGSGRAVSRELRGACACLALWLPYTRLMLWQLLTPQHGLQEARDVGFGTRTFSGVSRFQFIGQHMSCGLSLPRTNTRNCSCCRQQHTVPCVVHAMPQSAHKHTLYLPSRGRCPSVPSLSPDYDGPSP